MVKELRYWRLWARFVLAMTLALSLPIMVLYMLSQGPALTSLPAAAWTMIGGFGVAIGAALTMIVRAMSKNPSDLPNGDNDED